MSLSMDVGESEKDYDFKLYAKNEKGKECEVSPENKYCAYAQHYRDSALGSSNSEIINIRELAVAKYKTTVEPVPETYKATCPL